MYDNGIFEVIFLTFTFCKHRPVRNIWQPAIPLTDCGMNCERFYLYFISHFPAFILVALNIKITVRKGSYLLMVLSISVINDK